VLVAAVPVKDLINAKQRLVRVLGHELNNSLAPIKSIAGSLGALLKAKLDVANTQQ